MRTLGSIVIAICLVVLLGDGYLVVQVLMQTSGEPVQDGAMVTAQVHITPQDNLTTTYSNTEQFIQGQHSMPFGLEQRGAGMRPGEANTFSLSAGRGFGHTADTTL